MLLLGGQDFIFNYNKYTTILYLWTISLYNGIIHNKEEGIKMLNQFSRTELLIGKEGIDKLKDAKVAIFGIGGVGSFVVEGLVRAGVRKFYINR